MPPLLALLLVLLYIYYVQVAPGKELFSSTGAVSRAPFLEGGEVKEGLGFLVDVIFACLLSEDRR